MNPWPYDKDGYCTLCGIGQYKPHTPACGSRDPVAVRKILEELAQRQRQLLDGLKDTIKEAHELLDGDNK